MIAHSTSSRGESLPFLSPKPLHNELVVEGVLFWIKSPLRTHFFVICSAIFANMFLFGLFIGLAPFYRKDLDLSAFQLGSLFSVFALVPLLLIPVLSLCIDEIPHKFFFGVGGILCCISSLIMVFYDDVYWGVFSSRILHGFGTAMVWVTGPAVISEVFSIPSWTKAMSVVYIYANAAFLVGTVLGANSFDWTGSTVAIYVATFLMNVCTTGFVLSTLPPDSGGLRKVVQVFERRLVREGWDEYMLLLHNRNVVLLLLNVFTFSIATVVLQTFIPTWMQHRLHVSVAGAADIYAIMAISKIASQPACGRMTDYISPSTMSAIGIGAYGLFLPIISIAWSVPMVIASFVLVGIAMTAALLPSFITLSDYAEKSYGGARVAYHRRYALANSLWLTTFMLGACVAPVGIGAILDYVSESFQSHAAVLGALGAVMCLVQGPVDLVFAQTEVQPEEYC